MSILQLSLVVYLLLKALNAQAALLLAIGFSWLAALCIRSPPMLAKA